MGWRKVLAPSEGEATPTLPIIDLEDIDHPSVEKRRVLAKTICDAAISSGFFYIENHHVPSTSIDSVFHESKRFFHELSLDEKMDYDTEKHDHYYGYYPIKLDPNHPAGASKFSFFSALDYPSY